MRITSFLSLSLSCVVVLTACAVGERPNDSGFATAPNPGLTLPGTSFPETGDDSSGTTGENPTTGNTTGENPTTGNTTGDPTGVPACNPLTCDDVMIPFMQNFRGARFEPDCSDGVQNGELLALWLEYVQQQWPHTLSCFSGDQSDPMATLVWLYKGHTDVDFSMLDLDADATSCELMVLESYQGQTVLAPKVPAPPCQFSLDNSDQLVGEWCFHGDQAITSVLVHHDLGDGPEPTKPFIKELRLYCDGDGTPNLLNLADDGMQQVATTCQSVDVPGSLNFVLDTFSNGGSQGDELRFLIPQAGEDVWLAGDQAAIQSCTL